MRTSGSVRSAIARDRRTFMPVEKEPARFLPTPASPTRSRSGAMACGEVPVRRQWTSRLRRADSWGKRAGPLMEAPTWARLRRENGAP